MSHLEYIDMCPNCVSPLKCNGPHIPYGSFWRKYPKIYNYLHNRWGFDNNIGISLDGGTNVKNISRYLMDPNVKKQLADMSDYFQKSKNSSLKKIMKVSNQSSYSQCPGEAYDSFWEEENNQPTLNVDKLVEDLHWNGTEWVKSETVYRINYHRDGDLERRWKDFETMHMAISVAHNMIQSSRVAIESITREQKL